MKTIKCCLCGHETESAFYQMKLNTKNGNYNGTYNVCIFCVHKMFNKDKTSRK